MKIVVLFIPNGTTTNFSVQNSEHVWNHTWHGWCVSHWVDAGGVALMGDNIYAGSVYLYRQLRDLGISVYHKEVVLAKFFTSISYLLFGSSHELWYACPIPPIPPSLPPLHVLNVTRIDTVRWIE